MAKESKCDPIKRLDKLLEGRRLPPRLSTLAKFIREEIPDVTMVLEEGYCNTDWKPPGFRYIVRPDKGRKGTRIRVHRNGETLYDHNSAETYRSNSEVVRWIRNYFEGT